MKLLTGNDAVITSPTFVAADGYTPAATGSTPTLAVVSSAGQTCTVGAVSAVSGETGVYSATLQALAGPDLLSVTWTGAVSSADQVHRQQYEVVGGVYVPLVVLLAMPQIDLTKHPAPMLASLRDGFEETAERYLSHTYVARYGVETVTASSGTVSLSRTPLRSVLAAQDWNGTALVVAEWVVDVNGDVRAPGAAGRVTVRFTHGEDAPPSALVEACKIFVRQKALEVDNRIGRDVLSTFTMDGGTERFSTPDWDAGRPTGYLDVDRILNSLRVPGIA